MGTQYYLRNKERGYVGNSPMWWAKGGEGYTHDLDKAEKWNEECAARFVKENPEKWEIWPCEQIDKHAGRVFDSQRFEAVMQDILAAMKAGTLRVVAK